MSQRAINGFEVRGADGHPHAFDLLTSTRTTNRHPTTTIRLATDPSLLEGAFRISVPEEGGIDIVGGPFNGVIYAAQRLLSSMTVTSSGEISLKVGDVADQPVLQHRNFWTWDHSTNWDLERVGQQEFGALNTYQKDSDAFSADYMRLIDFASSERISSVIVYGLLRDSHGGVDAARQVCQYGDQRGVRVVAGVGVNAYGGVYFDGKHRFNLATWLKENPDLGAQVKGDLGFGFEDMVDMSFPSNEYMQGLCPSRPENLEWNRQAIRWLIDEVGVAGINFETGDYGSCGCQQCSSLATSGSATSWSFDAMASVYPSLLEETSRTRPDGSAFLNLVEVYWDNLFDANALDPLRVLPDWCEYQYCVNKGYWAEHRTELTPSHVKRLPRPNGVLRTHAASQWNRQRYSYAAPILADMAATAGRAGMRGMTIWGEASAYNPINEINYVAFSRFAWNPDLAWDEFWRIDVAPRFGGGSAAETFIRDAALLEDPAASAADVIAAADRAREGSQQSGEIGRRWTWLTERAHRVAYSRNRP